jgi:hypothetical protein
LPSAPMTPLSRSEPRDPRKARHSPPVARCSYRWQCRRSDTHGRCWAFARGELSSRSPVRTRDLTLWGPVAFYSHAPHPSRSPVNRARRAGSSWPAPRLEAFGGGSCHTWARTQRPRLRRFDPRAAGMAIPTSAVSRPEADPVRTRPFHHYQSRRFRSCRDDRVRRLITDRCSSLRTDGRTRGG